jgi:hypothetical protein
VIGLDERIVVVVDADARTGHQYGECRAWAKEWPPR